MVLIVLFLAAAGLGVYAIYDALKIRDGAELSSDIAGLAPVDGQEFNIHDLQEINEDIVAWLRVDGTHIDYPVVRGEDNTVYLNRDYKKEYATAGSVFLDYRNERDFKDQYSIVYGHNMRADLMFSDIKRFENRDFFMTHRRGTLYTALGTFQLDIMYYAKFSAFLNQVYNLITYRNDNRGMLLETFKDKATYERELELLDTDKLILLSTCNTAGSNDRAVLLARARLMSGTEAIGDEGELERLDAEKEKLKAQEETTKHESAEEVLWNIPLTTDQIMLVILAILVLLIFVVVGVQRLKIVKMKGSTRRKK